MYSKKNEGTNYAKIIVIVLSIVAGICAVLWFAVKLYRKYCMLDCCDCDEEMDELYDDAMYDEEGGCEVVLEEAEAAPAETEA